MSARIIATFDLLCVHVRTLDVCYSSIMPSPRCFLGFVHVCVKYARSSTRPRAARMNPQQPRSFGLRENMLFGVRRHLSGETLTVRVIRVTLYI